MVIITKKKKTEDKNPFNFGDGISPNLLPNKTLTMLSWIIIEQCWQMQISIKAINQIQKSEYPLSCTDLQKWADIRWNSLHWEICFRFVEVHFHCHLQRTFLFYENVAIINCINWLAKRSYPFLFRYVCLKWEQISIAIITIQT